MFMRILFSLAIIVGAMSPAFSVIDSNSESICGPSALDAYEGSVELEAIWTPDCAAGQYLPQGSDACATCLADSYCAGGTFNVSNSAAQGIQACGSGLKSQAGSRTANDCGHILHIGNNNLYLHADRRTTPSLIVDINGTQFYADTTPVSQGVKPISSETGAQTLRIQYSGNEYTVHSAIYQ